MEEKEEIERMVKEFAEANDEYPFEGLGNFKKGHEESYEEFYKGLEVNKHIDEINPNWANQTSYVLIDKNGHIYGAANIRHELKGKLFEIGGHVGYAIRPSERGKGLGTLILKLTLEKAKDRGLDKVYLGAYEDNVGSWKIMENCNAQFDKIVYEDDTNLPIKKYWIDIK